MYKLPHKLAKNLLIKIFGNNKNFRKISEKIGIDGTSSDRQPKSHISIVVLENCGKSAVKHAK